MIIFSLLLSMGLDMSLPEFQPTTDISGNYIVGSFDVSSDEIKVELMEDNPVSGNDSAVADSLSIAPADIAETSISDDDIVSLPVFSQTRSNSSAVTLPTNSILLHLDSANQIITDVGTGNNTYIYVELQPNVTYTIDTDAPRLILTTAFTVGNSYTSTTDTTYTPTTHMYAFVLNTRYLNVSYVPDSGGSGGDSGGSDLDLTELINAVESLHTDIKNLLRAVLFVCLFNFLYPIVISIKSNIIGGDK